MIANRPFAGARPVVDTCDVRDSALLDEAESTEAAAPGLTELPPGPRGPALLQVLRMTFDQPRSFAECRRRYGPTWTTRLPGRPPVVVTRDRDAIRRLFTGDPLTKRHGNDILRPILGDNSLPLLEPAGHLARRRLELPPFHGEAVDAYSERIGELAAAEVSSWEPGSIVEAHPRARSLTLGVILELVLGVRDAGLRDELARLFESLNTRTNNLGQFMPPALTRRTRWNVWGHPAYARLDRLRELLGDHLGRTRRDPALDSRTDVLALLVRARDDDGVGLTEAELSDELLTLVFGGHETTATAIAWACDLLAHTPAVAARLRESLAAGERDFLRATAKEVLRARTVFYVSAVREPLEPVAIGEWVVGPPVQVAVDAQGLHGDPELYPQPEEFRPERFLGKQPDAYAWLPFGGGAHRCLGAALALLEIELVVEAIATRVELEPTGPPARPVRRGVTLAPDNGARVRVRPAREQSRVQAGAPPSIHARNVATRSSGHGSSHGIEPSERRS